MSRIERWFPGTSVGDWTGGQFGGGASAPGAPGTLSLVSPAASDNSAVDLSWAPGLSGSVAVSGYHIQISTDGSSWSDKVANTGSSASTYIATGLNPTTQYWFRVAAINSVGEGDYGNEPSATSATVFAYTTTGSPTTRTYTSGGTSYKSLHWTSTGNFVLTANLDSVQFDVWVVAGGGGGGNGQYSGGYWGGAGGGGAGGAKSWTSQTLSNATHTMTVGAGGGGGVAGGYPPNGVAGTGSSAGSTGMSTSGGGYGGLYNYVGGNGGSGGGGGGWQGPIGGTGTSGQGNNGGQGGQETQSPMNGAGGGGKGGVGQGHTSSTTISYTVNGGAGGTGGTNDYADGTTSGVGVGQWAGGGGGGSQVGGAATHGGGAGGSSATGSAGTANTGGGGGGTGTDTAGGTGGSGSVIIRWVT